MSPLRILGWSAFALLLVATFLRPREGPRAGASFPARLFGPVASLASGWQWIRVRLAVEDGRPALAYARAELAFELDPGATSAWSFLGAHLAHDRASAARRRDPALGANWVRAALDLLERGEEVAREPAELAVHRGLLLVQAGDLDPLAPWPGGAAAAWREAQAAFERGFELDPTLSDAWVHAAVNRGLRLGSPELEPELADRRRALELALAILDRGAAAARRPEKLAYQRGLLLGLFAFGPDGAEYPGGRRALWLAAIEAFEEAERLGHPGAHHAVHSAELALEDLK